MRLNSHPVTFARLADLVEGRLDGAERAEAQAHVAACAGCTARVAELEQVTRLMRTDDSVDAPRDVLASAVALFGARRGAERPAPSLAGRILAVLTFDSARVAPAFGVRSGPPASGARQLMFSAGASDIDLRVARGEGGWTVSGQVLGDCAAGRVELEAAGEGAGARAEAEMNESCEFTLPPVPEGSYRLLLRLPDADIHVPEIELGA